MRPRHPNGKRANARAVGMLFSLSAWTSPFQRTLPGVTRLPYVPAATERQTRNARKTSARPSRSPRGHVRPHNRCRKSRVCRMRPRHPNGKRANAREPSAGRRERAPDETNRENRLPPRGFRPIPRPLASCAAARAGAVCARKTAAVGKQPVNSRTTFLRVRNIRTATARMRAPSACCSHFPRGQARSNEHCRKSRVCRMRLQHPNGKRAARGSRQPVILILRADKPAHAIAAGSRVSAVCARDTRTANARTRGSRQRDEGSVRRMKRIVKIGFRHADSVPFRAPSHPAPQYARRLYAPAKLPLWESNLSIRERHSCASAISERQPRECARRRHVVLAFRVDKPIPTNIAGSHASAICARGNRPANAQRAEDVSASFPFSARTRPPTQSLPEVAYLPYAPATPERRTRECARRRRVVLAFRVDKPVPMNITGSRASAICARGNRPANAQRAEDVSVSFPFSARTRPPTQSLPEVAYLPYAPATPERQTRERAGAVSGTKGACAG